MMDLPPAAVETLKNPGRADVQVFHGAAVPIRAALPADRPEDISDAMKRVIPKFDMDVAGPLKTASYIW